MAIYSGVGGVVRELDSIDGGISSVERHPYTWKAGVGGVVRTIKDITDQIDYVAIVVDDLYIYTVDSELNVVQVEPGDIETLNKYGSISITDTSITVACSTKLKKIDIWYEVYVVFKDGHRAKFVNVINNSSGENTFSMSVTARISFTNSGWYTTVCLGTALIEDTVSNAKSKTVTITTATPYKDNYMVASMKNSGTCTNRQTFNSVTINDKSFSIKVFNELS